MAISDSSLDAMSNFLALGLSNYAGDLTPKDREYAVALALDEMETPGDDTILGNDEGSLLAKLWDNVVFGPPQITKHSQNPVCWKEPKDPKEFICWARLCQAHREEVARKRGAPSAAEQGVPGSLPSCGGGFELSEDENTECFKLTMKLSLIHISEPTRPY